MKKARSLLYGKLYRESAKTINKYGFIVFKMTAQNTQSERKKNPALKIAIGRRNLQKTFQNPPTKPNRLMLKVFRKFLGLITTLKAARLFMDDPLENYRSLKI